MGSFAEKREGSLALSKIICIMKFLIILPVNPPPSVRRIISHLIELATLAAGGLFHHADNK
jgi:hypothetical protein